MKKYLVTAVLFFCSQFCFAQVLPSAIVVQEQSGWCWAACCQRICNYYGLSGDTVSQCHIADYTRRKEPDTFGRMPCCTVGCDSCNQGNDMFGTNYTMDSILSHFRNIKTYDMGVLSFDMVQNEINTGRPFIIGWAGTENGHVVVGHGIIDSLIYFMNPWPGEGEEINLYSWVKENDSHTWDETLVIACPSTITGTNALCQGTTTNLNDITPGGVWSSSNPGVASVGSNSGIVTGISAGIATISYTASCGFVTTVVTVNPLPAAITGITNLCPGSTTSLTSTTPGGNWSCSNGNVSIGSSTGIVTGIAAGSSIITYTLGTGCQVTTIVTVAPLSSPILFSGTDSICMGATVTLSNALGGGKWKSGDTSVAKVDSTSGLVTGLAGGVAGITYTLPGGCYTDTTVVVKQTPSISGPWLLCVGSTATYSGSPGGGTWSSSNSGILGIDATGAATALGPSSSPVSIIYNYDGCMGSKSVSTGDTTGVGGGYFGLDLCVNVMWSVCSSCNGSGTSSDPSVATIDSGGWIRAVGPGHTTMIITDGCSGDIYNGTVWVSQTLQGEIMPVTACPGGSVTVSFVGNSYPPGAGVWSVGNPPGDSSTIDPATGAFTAGNMQDVIVNVYYYIPGAILPYCADIPGMVGVGDTTSPSITGPSSICVGATAALGVSLWGTSSGWTSSSPSVATVDSNGVVTGISPGSTTISCPNPGCGSITTLTFDMTVLAPLPLSISGTDSICAHKTIYISDASPGGSWSSSNTSVGSVDATGRVKGINPGVTIISYTIGSCAATDTIVVKPNDAGTISGTSPIQVCVNGNVQLTDPVSGGVWSSSDNTIVYVGSTSGIAVGVSGALGTISYIVNNPDGCSDTATKPIIVHGLPPISLITGNNIICLGETTTLTDATGGGTWSSVNTDVATVASTGSASCLVTAACPTNCHTAIIYTTTSNGCKSTDFMEVYINSSVPAITGKTSIGFNDPDTVSNSGGYGNWYLNGVYYGSGPSLIFLGGVAGTVTVSYVNGCGSATLIVTINLPPISGASTVNVGSNVTLNDAATGGTWSSGNPGIASINTSTGVVTGVSPGTVVISYSLSGSYVTAIVTVNIPSISGASIVPVSGNATLSDASPGGAWSSGNPGIASINASTGIVTGVSPGVVVISYTLSGLFVIKIVTVNVSSISGASTVNVGGNITLSDAAGGGAWSASNGNATVSGGVVTGVSAGTVTISYTVTGSFGTAYATIVITVNATSLTAINGATNICTGTATTLTNATTGGIWSSSSGVATINSTTGVMYGAGTGTATITYTLGSLFVTATVTVNATPSPLLGTRVVCTGATTSLSDGIAGGMWSAGGGAAIVNSTGLVTGMLSGTTVISYTLSTGCGVGAVVTVNTGPAAITGNVPTCVGSALLLNDAVNGGVWSSGNTSVATVGSGSGLVTGVAGGVVMISYTINANCSVSAGVTVNASAGIINGPSSVCAGQAITLTDATPGGVWSSSNTAVGTISTGGIVSGISAGTTIITYTAPTGCQRMVTISVGTAPTAINGKLAICGGATTTLTDATAGGAWSISSALIASINSATGLVTASSVYTGTATISYTAGGCAALAVFTVTPRMAPIQGATSECIGATITLSDATAGGTWSCSNDNVILSGTAGSTVSVTGATAGACTITYATGSGCYVTYANTVYANPAPITGIFQVCTGAVTTLSDVTAGGAWTSSAPAVASASGYTISGVAAGTATISYKITPGNCVATQAVTVNPVPVVSAISGPSSISHATPVTLSDVTAGGIWSSTNPGVISLSGSTGTTVTATALTTSGASMIGYAVTNGFGCTTKVTKSIINTARLAEDSATGIIPVTFPKGEVLLYPNPTNGEINIRADVAGVFYLFSLDGRKLKEYKITEGISSMILPNEFAIGIYIGKYVGDNGNIAMFKIIKN